MMEYIRENDGEAERIFPVPANWIFSKGGEHLQVASRPGIYRGAMFCTALRKLKFLARSLLRTNLSLRLAVSSGP